MRFLFYISQNYSFEILRPLQKQILNSGWECAWFVEGNAVNRNLFAEDEVQLQHIREVVSFSPDATFVPGNIVPDFIPGIKVQVFHGFEWKKKGHWRIRGFFDLYCTQGPFFTQRFLAERETHPHFDVVETGWPKLDPLFQESSEVKETGSQPTILFAPTFSPSLTSAPALLQEIKRISAEKPWRWIVKFHPKMATQWINEYKQIAHENLLIADNGSVIPWLKKADVMLSDTSSVITEFALLKKPVVTYQNASPENHLIDIRQPEALQSALEKALQGDHELLHRIDDYAAQMHPYFDGLSSQRVLEATCKAIEKGRKHLKPKPSNWLRKLKLRKRLGYWGR